MSPSAISMGSTSLNPESQQATSIGDLPNELLVQIFESVPVDYVQRCKTFPAIARVNRHFHSIITPLLYRDFEDCCAKHLQLFGRTVLSNKGCAELVKHYEGRRDALVFNSTKHGCPMVWNDFILHQPLEEAVLEQLPDLPKPITRAVFSHALACALPCLQKLDVSNGGNQLMRHLTNIRPHENALFQQLRTLSIATEPDRTYRLHSVSLLFTLPSLRTLVIDMAALNDEELEDAGSVEALWQCDPQSSTVQELTLERCGLPAQWIVSMIESCRSLRTFFLEHYYWDTSAQYYLHIVGALTQHRDTLSDIRMNALNGCRVSSSSQKDPPHPISFRDFTSLTHLDIPLFIFATRTQHCSIDNLLPCSIQVLTVDLRSTREGFSDDFFISMAEAAPHCLPMMHSVEILSRIEEYQEAGSLPLHFCHLRRMFNDFGIELVYFLEFVNCEFKAGNVSPSRLLHTPDTFVAYMKLLLKNLRLSGPDGCEMANRSSLEAGCLEKDDNSFTTISCGNRSDAAQRAQRNWGYMKPWTGRSEYDLMTS
jgi:hypothetical protein